MDHQSLWQKTASFSSELPSLRSDLNCEAVVVGAGLTGVLTAWFLQKQGIDVVVLDSGVPGQNATAHTTAKITAQHGFFYANLIQSHGIENAKKYFYANQSSIDFFDDLIKSQSISCDFQKTDCYLYARSSSSAIRAELDALKAVGAGARYTRETELPFPISAALKLENQAIFHPLKFLYALIPHLRIFGNTAVKKLSNGTLITDYGIIKAKHIIFATRFPFFAFPGLFFSRMHQERSYSLSICNVPPLSSMYLDANKNGVTFRPWDSQIILSGFGHRTGYASAQNGYDALQLFAQRWYPGYLCTAQWAAEDSIPADNIPYIGQYQHHSTRIYVAAGFQKWGMTSSMTSARILTDLVCGRKNKNTDTFSPHRIPNIKAFGKIIYDGGISTGNLLKQTFYIPRSKLADIKPGDGGIVQWNGCKYGVFHHESGQYYFVSTRCPHMGCQLSWNPVERSWDCPCHGSRFSYDGQRLDPPANKNLSCKHREV